MSQKSLPDTKAWKLYLCPETLPLKKQQNPSALFKAAIGNEDFCWVRRGEERRLLGEPRALWVWLCPPDALCPASPGPPSFLHILLTFTTPLSRGLLSPSSCAWRV